MASLDPTEIARYSRHLTLPEVGVAGQLRLRAASMLLVGAGGLGSPLAIYLAAAGVGRLGLVDFDRVDMSNLQRQVLYGTGDVGELKIERAAARIREINPGVEVELHPVRFGADNAEELLSGYDLVIDGTDNFATRYLVNDACVLSGKPNVYGSVFRFEGQVSIFAHADGPCYRCLYPDPPDPGSVPNCAEGGVLGVLPGIIGTLQATEAIKWVLGEGESLVGRLVLFDALEMRFRELKLRRDPDCPVCGTRPTIRELGEVDEICAVPTTEEDTPTMEHEIDPIRLKSRLDAGETIRLLDVRSPEEWAICRIEGAQLIPLPELASRIEELSPTEETVVYCHSGIRSAMAAGVLRGQGFDSVLNLSGGIDAWSRQVDASVPRY